HVAVGEYLLVDLHARRPIVPGPIALMLRESSLVAGVHVAFGSIAYPGLVGSSCKIPPVHFSERGPGTVVYPGTVVQLLHRVIHIVEAQERRIARNGKQMRIADGAV